MAATTTLPDGRKLLRGDTIQCRIAPTDAVGEGSAIVAPDRATATSSRNNLVDHSGQITLPSVEQAP